MLNIIVSRFPTFSRVSGQLKDEIEHLKDPAFLHSVGYQDANFFRGKSIKSRFPTFSRVSGL